MRCLTKCFSLHGLANYIYSGDGLPTEDVTAVTPPEQKVKAKPKAKAKAKAKKADDEKVGANGAVSEDEMALALKEACNKAAKGGWLPDSKTQGEIKAALKSNDVKAIAKLVNMVNELSKAALQIHDEQGDLRDA